MNIRKYSLLLIASSLVGSVALAQSPAPAAPQPIVKAAVATEKTADVAKDQKIVAAKPVATNKQVVAKTAATTHKTQAMSKQKTAKADMSKTPAGEKKETTKVEVKTEVKTSEPASKTAAVVKTK